MVRDSSCFKREEKELLKIIFNFAKSKKLRLYIVGGALRDIILKRKTDNPDIDFCIKDGALKFTKKLAQKINAAFVVLDKEHGACRLVKRIKDNTYTLDFTDFRGKSLSEDLFHRDFTINTLALDLENAFSHLRLSHSLIDHYQGIQDLRTKIIRVVNRDAFDEDPLRILRAFSLASIFGFKIDKETLNLIKLKKKKLSEVSSERIRDELFKILDQADAYSYLIDMDKLGILRIIMPQLEVMRNVKQGPYHHLDVLRHSLATVKELESLVKKCRNNQEIYGYINQVISPPRRRRALIKLGALLHDIGKPETLRHRDGRTTFYGHERKGVEIVEDIAKCLKISNDECAALKKMVLWHLRPGYLADIEELTPRAKFRFFRDTNTEAISTLLLSIADQRATKGRLTTKESRIRHEETVFNLIKEYFRRLKEEKPPRLINGNDLLKKFKLEPSPLIGKILREIEELQAIGKIKTRQEAFKVAKRLIK